VRGKKRQQTPMGSAAPEETGKSGTQISGSKGGAKASENPYFARAKTTGGGEQKNSPLDILALREMKAHRRRSGRQGAPPLKGGPALGEESDERLTRKVCHVCFYFSEDKTFELRRGKTEGEYVVPTDVKKYISGIKGTIGPSQRRRKRMQQHTI